ncbi:ribonuclease domain-containing protein [Kosakonia sacchari]|uniref:Ribonuclease n=1 Tax=Kosakonia sacchari TaxID=1158459 RepID=A0A1G4YUY0_9ENTR|nr:ribonuclease domain-containing protein [Kosakonia sacchari]AHJ75439.1 ribonuclease [Kosakonia sacchari SP1]MDN2487443.1 ribonuclease [Kosakonia sacchari]SCX57206.1 ribonuclease [Kosakonia sacchari]
MKRYLPIVTFVGLLLTQPAWAELPQCSAVVQAANQELAKLNKKTVQDDKKLTALLKTLNRDDVLPADYVTREQAIKLGWSGKAEDSLWSVWALNKKQLGGDPWSGKPLPGKGKWYSADIDSVRGLRSNKHLIYSPDSATRYLTTDNDATTVTLPPCQ